MKFCAVFHRANLNSADLNSAAVFSDSIKSLLSNCQVYMLIAICILGTSCGLSSSLTRSTSEITCPYCGHQEIETLPTDYCIIAYDCKECGETIRPEGDDCCVFCTHGTHKCPSKQ